MNQSIPEPVRAKTPAKQPVLSIGLPVYNGAQFLAETIDSILHQTFNDFELIISDNASTDSTEAISRSYASADERVTYHRNKENLGAAKNYNQLVTIAKGKYFKWAAADDLIAPEYLAKCITVLDANPNILVCQTAVRIVDENNQHLRDYDDCLHFMSDSPHQRLNAYLFRPAGMWNAVFGVIRIKQLRQTPLIGTYVSSDQVLLGELILRGKVYQIPERLFSRRMHAGQAGGAYKAGDNKRKAIAAWFDPNNSNRYVLPVYLKLFVSYMSRTSKMPLSVQEKLRCYTYFSQWYFEKIVGQKITRLKAKCNYSAKD